MRISRPSLERGCEDAAAMSASRRERQRRTAMTGLVVRGRIWLGGLEGVKILAAEFCVGSGPGLEAADAVVDFGGGAGEIDQAIFFLQDGRESCFRVVLKNWLDGCGL